MHTFTTRSEFSDKYSFVITKLLGNFRIPVLTLLFLATQFQTYGVVSTGYLFTQSSSTYTAVSGGTTLGNTSNDEQVFIINSSGSTTFSGGVVSGSGFPIGFTFNYNGTNYSNFAVSTNGFIVLGNGTFSIAGSTGGFTTPLSSSGSGVVNAISAFGYDIQGQSGSAIRYVLSGSSPNRVLVVQWSGYRRYVSGGTSGENLNFQIRLNETSNTIDIVYGTFTNTLTTNNLGPQVGIRGANNSDVNNREVDNGVSTWATSTAGNSNTDICEFRNTFVPSSGQKYSWGPCTSTSLPPTVTADEVCGSGVVNLSAVPGTGGSTTRWYSASTGGTLLTSGLTYSPNISSTTTYYVATVDATGCEVSTRTSVIGTVNALPTAYTVGGGGSFCIGGSGASVTLSDSDTGIEYQLKLGASDVGSPMNGTGSGLNFGLQTGIGTYTVVATNTTTSCTRTMTGSAVTSTISSPSVTSAATNTLLCGPGSTSLSSTANSNITATTNFSSGTLNTNIPNNSSTGITSTIVVSGAPSTMAQVTGFTVTLNVNHNNLSDIEAYLVRPGGTALSTSSNGSLSNTTTAGSSVCLTADAGGSGNDYTNTVFSDLASQTTNQTGTAPFSGTYRPINLFSTFTGNPNGTWTLKVLDDNNPTSGTLESWTISLVQNGITYSWTSSPSGYTSSVEDPGVVTPTVTTNYIVTVTNANGCTSSSSNNVVVDPALSASCVVTADETCFGANNGILTVNAVGGTGPFVGTGTFNGLAHGTYSPVITDNFGCTATCTSTIVVADNTPPVITGCPSDFTVNSDPGECGAFVTWVEPTATDNCSVAFFTSNYYNGDLFSIGLNSVTYIAQDPSGNQSLCFFDVTVIDVEPPVITCPADIVVNSTSGICGAAVTFAATATDNCSAVLSYSPASGSIFPVGTTLVTATATDPEGNTDVCTFNVTVNDTEFPAFTGCPSNIVIGTNGSCDRIVTWTPPVATDNCSGVSSSSNYNPGDVFPLGTTIVTYTAVDGVGNTTICTFDVTVEDHENPVVSCPGDITITANAAGCSAIATFSATVTDNCSATLAYSHVSGSAFSGTTPVTVTATDPSGNTSSCTFNVIVVNDLVASSSSTAILCNGGSATVTVTATGGTSPYTGEGSFTVTAGTYTYTVTDANGCSSSTTITVSEPAVLAASSSSSAVLCNGGSATVTVTATGGTAPYSGDGSFTVTAGTYNYTVADANGCTSNTSITVTEPAVLSATSVQGSAILCNGGTTTVTVSAIGGTSPYTGDGSFTVGAGTHNYTITDANGCTTNTSITVSEPTALVSTSIQGADILCNGGTTTVSVSATGGTAPYTGEGTFTVSAGVNTFTVTDANGCTGNTSITVSQPTALVASATSTAILCNGGSATVTVSATGGTAPYSGDGSFTVTAGTYNYTVTDANGCTSNTSITVTEPATFVASSSATSILCNGGTATVTVSTSGGTAPFTGDGTFTVTAGTYNYTITDAGGCTSNTSITISEPTALVASSSQGAAILCNGGSTTITVSATGGTAPYSGDGTFTVTAGTHNYTVTDANGCTSNTSVTVTEPTAVVVSATQGASILCNGGSTTVTVSATGGTSPYSGEGTFTVTAGTYNYTITDDNGCTGSTSITVSEPSVLVASSSSTAILCNGGTATITVSATGGTAPYSGDGSFTVTAGTYNYTVTDANGCASNTSITVTEPAALVASSSSTAILCNGGSATVTVSATGGTAPYSGDGSFTVTAGTYNYTVTDANGCTSNTSITISEPTALVASSTQGAAILCNGGSTTVTVSATGGTAPYSGDGSFTVTAGTYNYTVTDANGCTSNTSITVSEPAALVASSSSTAILCNGGSATVTVSATGGTAPYSGDGSFTVTAGTYNYTVTDANGCTSNTSITVSEPTALTASSSATAILCNGGSATVTVSATGGTAPYSGDGSFTVTAGTYNYTVTDANGCTSNTSITVSEPSALVASSTQGAAILCNGGSTTVTVSVTGGTAPYSGDGTFTVTAGTYNYTVTDANGCTSNTSITVTEPAALVASSSSTAILCNGGSATVTVSATGGTAPYSGDGSFTVTAGTYNYTVTDANGCTSNTSITVSEPIALTASSSATAILCNGGSATVTVSATGGTAPYSGDGSFTVTAGTYNYAVTDANGCTSNTSITVSEPSALVASSTQGSAILCNGGSTTVTVSVTGGTAPYSGDGSFTVTAGTYNYTVTDANGCTSNTSITVTEPSALVASSSSTAILCNGGSATVTVLATGGSAPYSGDGTFTVTAGTYNYTVIDANGCTSNTSITVSEPAVLAASATSTDASCLTCADGTATVSSITGGTAPYTVTPTSPATGLLTGNFCFTITDANGCSTTACTMVGYMVCNISASAVETSPVLCNGGTATVVVSAIGGTAPITGEGTFTVTAGTYTYTLTDDNGCLASTTITISEPAALVASSSATSILCNGGSATVTVSATGGTAPYSGDGSFTVTAGTYNYTVTDANGCTSNTSITVSEPTALTASSSSTAILCNGGSATVTVSATGGTAPYSGDGSFTVTAGTYNYTVTDANGCASNTSITVSEPTALTASSSSTGILCNGGSATVTVSATGGTAPYSGDGSFTVPAGTYNYTVTDANGCTSITSITVSEPTALTASSSATAILCNGGSATITVSATDGTAPYSGDGSFTVTAGTYNYTVTDANGCTSNTSITVTEPSALVASSSSTAILCNGGSATVTVSATGGTTPYSGDGSFTVTAGTYNYTVTDANGCTSNTSITVSEPSALVASSSSTAILCNGGSATVTVSATGGTAPYSGDGSFTLTAGTYNYTVTDANGCTSNTSITVTEPTALVASSSATAILCNGGSATVTVSATGGTVPYSGDGSFTVTAGTYNYTVTDANGCTSNTSITVTEPSALVASSSSTAILCNGGSATVTVSATGGTAPYSGDGSFTVTAGTYNYTVTDANGCTSNTSITVTEPSALVASSSSTAILCNGGSATVTVSTTGGTAPYSGDGSFTVTAGTYNYTVTDANGCTSNTSITVSEPSALVASSSSTAILCNGGSATVTVSATGGTAPYSGDGTFTVTAGTYNYTVTDANGCTSNTSITVSEPTALAASSSATAILCNGGSATVTVSVAGGTAPYSGDGTFTVTAGTYNYTVTDANGCTSNTSITVSEPTALTASSSATAILCNGGSATVTVSATGGTAPYSGDGSFTVTAGTYNYTVTDANGCTSNTSITVSEPSALVASSSSTAILCNGGSATVTVSATGGTAPYSGDGSFTVTAGTYNYTVTDANGCTSNTSITVSEPTALTASSSSTAILCNGGSATVTVSATGGTAPYSGDGSFTVTAGTYNYTVTDANGCTSNTSITVSEPTALTASSSSTAILCNGGSATITVSATGGTAPYSGDGSFTVTAGTYNYTVTDANGCTSNTSITVSEPTALTASSSSTAILCNGGSATVTVSVAGGTAPYSGDGSFTVTAGTYNYTVTDANGCTSNTSITVSEPSALVASSSSTAILCNGGSATVTVSATGGTAPYSGDGSFTVTAGTYNYTVTDANGCTSNTSITVTEPSVLVASSSASTIDCIGGTTDVTVSATGGTAPYSGTGLFNEAVGTYTYTVTDANGCTATTTITLTQVDNQDPIFVGCPNNITINTSGACTQTVNWIAPTATDNCSATVSSTHNPGDVFPIGTTTVTYTAVDPNGNSATCSFTVTVEDHENPVVTCPSNIAVNNDPGSCGAVVNFTASVTDNCSATLSYSHASGSVFPIGTTVVTVTGTDASGNSSSCSFNVVVTDSEYPLLTACPADIVTCSPVVNWTAPTATDNCTVTVSSNINPGSTFSTGTTVVTYSAIDASGNTTTCSFNVTVNIPSVDPTSISSSTGSSMCNSGTTILSVVGGSLGTGAQWVWYSGTCGGTPAGTGASITVTPGATTSYFVRAEGGCANSNCASTTITVFTGIPSGVVNTINGAISVCPGSSGVYTVNAVSNTGTYVWSAPAGTLINGLPSPVSTTTNSATLTFGTLPIGQSGYNICVFASNPCGSTAAKCAWIRGDLSTPNFFTAPTVICAGTTVTYEVSALAGASSYIWSATGGATITGSGTSVQVTFPANYTTGSVCVAGQSPCGLTSAQRCVTVTSSPGLPGVITGPVTVCPGSTESYSIAPVNGAASYIWTAPAGASISGPSNGLSITVVYTAGFVSGQVTVKSVNTCGAQSGVRAKSVSTGKLPTPGNIVGDVTSGVCGQTYQYSIPSLANATLGYVWTIPAGVTVIGPSTSNSITLQFPASFVSGTLSVAGNNGCGLGYARSVNVYGNPATPGAISGNTSVCSGSVELYSWAPVPGTSYYQIQAPVGSTILSGNITTNTFVLIQWGTTGGNIGIKAINGCGVSGTRTLNASISCRTAAEQVMTDKLIVEAYPNPNRGQFSVSIDSKTDATYTLRILDQTGRILKASVMNATEGLNVQEFDLEGIAAGMYVLRVETENREVINKSIIVQ